MRERRRTRLAAAAGALALAVAALGCGAPEGGPAPSTDQRFVFVRSAEWIVRIDTQTGESWFVPASGDGGWTVFGRLPSSDGGSNDDGRYALFRLNRRGAPTPGAGELMRVDRFTGRSWLGTPRDGAEWVLISEPRGIAGETPDPAPAPTPEPRMVPVPDPETRPPRKPPSEELKLMPSERFGETPEEMAKNVAVVLRALEKDGLPVEIKVWGAKQLGVLDPEVAVPPLLDALGSDEPQVVVAAIESLQQLGDPSTIPAILKLKDHPDPRVRAAVDEVVVEVR